MDNVCSSHVASLSPDASPECITTQEHYIPYLDFLTSVGLTSMGRLR